MTKPSEAASFHFKRGVQATLDATNTQTAGSLLPIMVNLLQGLDSMNTGQRAVYLKLEQLEARLIRLEQAARRP